LSQGGTVEIITTVKDMQERAESLRTAGKTIAFVPTMGYLHPGHISLVEEGRKRGDVLVVSIFVNPTQFGPSEDLAQYPRDFDRDARLCEEAGTDVIFSPDAGEMYPPGYQTFVEVEKVSQRLCGDFRPGHFRGVATVVLKLLAIVKPHVAIFGEKDYQQLLVITRMVKDLHLGVEIAAMPTFREADGLAMSSRNTYLSAEERRAALSLSRSLREARALLQSGERNPRVIERTVKESIGREPLTRVEYATVCNREDLSAITEIEDSALLALAVRVGKTRLIDNCILDINGP